MLWILSQVFVLVSADAVYIVIKLSPVTASLSC